MKKHKVILHPDAELDIESSFKWGRRAWGEENAKEWVRKLRQTFRKQSRFFTSEVHTLVQFLKRLIAQALND